MTHTLKYALMLFSLICTISLDSLQAGWFDKIKEVIDTGGSGSSNSSLSDNDVAGALKEALSIGSENVAGQLSAPGGFNSDSNIRIPLPDSLQTVQKTMNKFGMGSSLNDLEKKLNEAAETSTEKAKPLFLNAIKEMSWEDAKTILNGSDDAATQYFKGKMSSPLSAEMKPIVDNSLNQVGAIKTYNNAMG